MGNREMTLLPALPMPPAGFRREFRLLRGASEQAVVRVLVAQRERYYQSNGQVSLWLTQDELLERLGLAARALRQVIWRVNPKLATQNHIIAGCHCFGQLQYAIFSLQEIQVSPPKQAKV